MQIINKKNSAIKEYFLLFLFSAFAVIMATGKFSYSVSGGISLWAVCVLPSLFPYLFITAILSKLSVLHKFANKLSPLTERLFNVGGECAYAYLSSIISGYPIGAKTVSDLRLNGFIGEVESERASVLCSTSSPVFLIGSVGSLMMKNTLFGVLLFAVHLLSSIISGIIFSFYKRKQKPHIKSVPVTISYDNLLYDGVYSAVISVLVVGGLITVFFILTEILNSFGLFNIPIKHLSHFFKDENLSKGIVLGLFECTRGLNVISAGKTTFLTLPVCAFICGFGGLSVFFQSLAFLKKAKIKTALFFFAKIIQAVLGFTIGLIFSLIL